MMLEDYFRCGMVPFQGRTVKLPGSISLVSWYTDLEVLAPPILNVLYGELAQNHWIPNMISILDSWSHFFGGPPQNDDETNQHFNPQSIPA